jgi:hypothetical protein
VAAKRDSSGWALQSGRRALTAERRSRSARESGSSRGCGTTTVRIECAGREVSMGNTLGNRCADDGMIVLRPVTDETCPKAPIGAPWMWVKYAKAEDTGAGEVSGQWT